jgi:vanillate O-demethylase monooxygenase subunit
MDYAASYLLINDNLTDFSHLSYVHASSFGASEEFARTRPTITGIPRGIRVQRWVVNGFRTDAESALAAIHQDRVDDFESWQTYDYLAPGILLMYNASYPRGTADRLARAEPDPERDRPVRENFTSQAVTPMTPKTSRYFFSWGPRSGEGSNAMAEGMMAVAQKAFAEDRAVIEGQQRIIDFDPTRRELLTSADLGPTQMRRVIEDLLHAESDAATQKRVSLP